MSGRTDALRGSDSPRRRSFSWRGVGAAGVLGIVGLLVVACDGRDRSSDAESRAATSSSMPAPGKPEQDAARPWNVIVITMDTTRADALRSYGQPRETSPVIDRLAAEGVLFEQVVAPSPNTLPSHSTLFTGKQPYSHGARSNTGFVLSEQNVTLAEVLREHGYATGAEIAAAVMREESQIGQGFDELHDTDSEGVTLKKIARSGGGAAIDYPIRIASDVRKRGVDFIRKHRSHPFFLWLHFFDAHNPYAPPIDLRSRFADEPYLAEIAGIDRQIGQLLAELSRLGLAKKTLVVVTSDHGEARGEHGEQSHMYYVYESTMRVPLIFWGTPAVRTGLRVDSPVRLADVAPTILDLLDLPPLAGAQGVSLRSLLDGSQESIALLGYGESLELHRVYGAVPLRFVRDGRWKYIHKVNPELYDLEADPGELENLAQREPERVAQMQAQLRRMLSEASAKPSDATIAVDEATRDQLVALGYAATETTGDDGSTSQGVLVDEIASLALAGRDPNEIMRDVTQMSLAQGFIVSKDYARARQSFGELLSRSPESAHLHLQMALALAGLGEIEEAEEHLLRAIALEPHVRIHLRELAKLYRENGRAPDAIEPMRALVAMDACDPIGQSLSETLHALGRYAEEIELLEAGARHCDFTPAQRNNLAWLLATVPDDALRDGPRALEILEGAIAELPRPTDPMFLDTLAAAHAAAGNFEEAIRLQRQVVANLEQQRAPAAVVAALREHLTAYEAGRVWRE